MINEMGQGPTLTLEEARALLNRARRQVRSNKKSGSEHILKKIDELEAAIDNAELFMIQFRVVDHGMISQIVAYEWQLNDMKEAERPPPRHRMH